jgi:N-acetylmuramoyl-L-alanine amidase
LKRFLTIILVSILAPVLGFIEPFISSDTVKVIVLDAGHGGKDPGNVGTKRYHETEKHVALDVTLLVGKYIKENMPGVKVIYTRDTDKYLELYERSALANRNKGDLFVSIHCNAWTDPAANGTETFLIGLHKTAAQFETAKRENSVILMEENYEVNYEGFDPNSPESYIALTLYQDAYFEQSLSIAQKVQYQFRERVQRKDRGVKQAGFYVISRTLMPSVLIELGFLTNKEEEDFLQSKAGKEYMASAIFRAIKEYVTERETGTLKVKDIDVNGKKDPEMKVPEAEVVLGTEQPSAENVDQNRVDLNKVIFKVQFKSSSKPINLRDAEFNKLQPVDFYQENGLYKYTHGATNNLDEAKALREKVKTLGFPDAFVVCFHKGKRISFEEAMRLMNN